MVQGAAVKSILSFLLSFAMIFSPFPLKKSAVLREFDCGKYSYEVRESVLEKAPGVYRQRSYTFETGEVSMLRAEFDEAPGPDKPVPISFYELEAAEGVRAEIFTDGCSCEAELSEGICPCDAVLITTDSAGIFIDMPKSYADIGATVVKENRDRSSWLRVRKKGGKLLISAETAVSGKICDCLVLTLNGPKKTDCKKAATLWTSYLRSGEARWLYDGYYRTVPAAYIPTCEKDGYYRCAASFVINVLAKEMKGNRACAFLALACWDSVMQNQNEEGFWATGPESVWLSGDYGIKAGFFDTRFNTDLMLTGCDIYDSIGELPELGKIQKYASFYIGYLENNAVRTANGGLLAADYKGPGQDKAVHTSLNHQAAEILAAFRLSKLLKRPDLAGAAEKLLLGIESGGEGWIKPNGDFWYSVSADGSFLGKDYESLTYDDLLTLKRYLEASGKDVPGVFDRLLKSKLSWMNDNNIGDYLK